MQLDLRSVAVGYLLATMRMSVELADLRARMEAELADLRAGIESEWARLRSALAAAKSKLGEFVFQGFDLTGECRLRDSGASPRQQSRTFANGAGPLA